MILDEKKTQPIFNQHQAALAVSRLVGKDQATQRREMSLLHDGPGLLSPSEYYYYRLFDDTRLSISDKLRFLGRAAQNKILPTCTGRRWWGVVHDKIVFQLLLGAYGFPMPRIAAVYHGTRSVPGAQTLRDNTAAGHFLRSADRYPLFGKPIDGMFSLGSVRLDRYDRQSDSLRLANDVSVRIDDFLDELSRYRKRGYLFQDVEHPESSIRAVCGDRLACLRLVILMTPDGPRLFRVLWKIPVGRNVADNFWRDGNMLGDVDVDTGRIKRVIAGTGVRQREVERHPDTGRPMIGFEVPQWSAIKTLCNEASAVIAGLQMQAWDVAVCDRGPVVIEVNAGGDFNLPQLSTGVGLLDEEFELFLRQNGYRTPTARPCL